MSLQVRTLGRGRVLAGLTVALTVTVVLAAFVTSRTAASAGWGDSKLAYLNQLRAQQLAYIATLPKGPSLAGLPVGAVAQPLLPQPAWSQTVAEVPLADRRDGPALLRHADSVWQDGSLAEAGATLWDPYYVWTSTGTATDPSQPVVGSLVVNATRAETLAQGNHIYPCPRDIGKLRIVAIRGDSVSLLSDSGVQATLRLASGQWAFR